jgi:hypothetical protein
MLRRTPVAAALAVVFLFATAAQAGPEIVKSLVRKFLSPENRL